MNANEIDVLPTIEYVPKPQSTASARDPETQDCHICLSIFNRGDVLRTLPCCHQFHSGCIDKWLQVNKFLNSVNAMTNKFECRYIWFLQSNCLFYTSDQYPVVNRLDASYKNKHQSDWLSCFRCRRSIWVLPCCAIDRFISQRVGLAGQAVICRDVDIADINREIGYSTMFMN